MIVRRFAQALKEQNWAAIAIEFVLLVLGEFLGIQVCNWNQECELRSKGKAFSARLHEDIRIQQWREARQIAYYRQVRKNAEQALAALGGSRPLSDEQLLVSAYRGTQYLYDDRSRSTYDELVSTGAMELIADARLRQVANDTFTTPLYDRIFESAQNSEYRKLFRETLSFEVQDALSTRCGDRLPRALDYAAIAHILDYPCTLDLPEASIRDAASALRAQPRMVPALQLRHADLGTAITDLSRNSARKARAR